MTSILVLLIGVVSAPAVMAAEREREVDRLLKELLAPPNPQAPPGFTAKVVIPRGEIFYDPLYMVPHGDEVWIMDDGGQKGDKGSQVVAVDRKGNIKRVLLPIGSVTPLAGMDVAPQGFGDFGGQIFTASQSGVDNPGTFLDGVVHRIDPKTGAISIFCKLPRLADGKTSGWPAQGVFGPADSPFARRFMAVVLNNNTIYQVTADARCVPFVTLAPERRLRRITFALDGRTMLVSSSRGGTDRLASYRVGTRASAQKPLAEGGPLVHEILRVSPEGEVQEKPFAEISESTGEMRFAPQEFGPYGGQLFFTRRGAAPFAPGDPRPLAQPIKADGAVYRVTPEGKTEIFATGLINPATLTFIDNKTLWVGNEGHQFYQRELPDGAIVEIKAP